MKKKTIIAIITTICLVLTCAVGVTYAWLTYRSHADIKYSVGTITYEITEVDKPATELVPGQPLSNFKIVNKSTILTDMRIKVQITSTLTTPAGQQPLGWTIGTDASKDKILIELNAGWTIGTDGYFYLNQIPIGTKEGSNVLSPFKTIKINPDLVGTESMGAAISISYDFEVKQSEYVTWEGIGTITAENAVAK